MVDLDAFEGVRRNEPMRRHTSWRVGGPADLYFEPQSEEALARFLAALPDDVPVYVVGLGSNLLVRDAGVRGAVIVTRKLPRRLERLDDLGVRAGAGVACATLARQCVRWSLGPAAFFAGIPGTVGGALAMNAGAFGGETWDRVESVETLDRRGRRRTRPRADYDIGYRHVALTPAAMRVAPEASADSRGFGEFFLAATFRFERDDSLDMSAIREMLDRRAATQPTGVPSCGSVFRNPPDTHSGVLIERAGLKGLRVGGAQVSEKHANFIVNTGDATAADIERLIETVRQEVADRFGIELVLEAKIIGERRQEGQ